MVRATNAMRLMAGALAALQYRPRKLTTNTKHAISFFGSACVLFGVTTAFLVFVPGQAPLGPGPYGPVIEQRG